MIWIPNANHATFWARFFAVCAGHVFVDSFWALFSATQITHFSLTLSFSLIQRNFGCTFGWTTNVLDTNEATQRKEWKSRRVYSSQENSSDDDDVCSRHHFFVLFPLFMFGVFHFHSHFIPQLFFWWNHYSSAIRLKHFTSKFSFFLLLKYWSPIHSKPKFHRLISQMFHRHYHIKTMK